MEYFLKELFSSFIRVSKISTEEIDFVRDKIEEFVRWEKPDFVALIGPDSMDTFPFQKNLNLNFYGTEETIYSAVQYIPPNQQSIIAQIDILIMDFLFSNPIQPMDVLFKLRFNVEFEPGNVRTLVRKAHVISVSKTGKPKIGLLGVTDITGFVDVRGVVFDAKTSCDNTNVSSKPLAIFVDDINKIIHADSNLKKNDKGRMVSIVGLNSEEELTIRIRNFIYATSRGHYIDVFYINETKESVKVTFRNSFSNLKTIFDSYSCVLACHRSFIINTDHVVELLGSPKKPQVKMQFVSDAIPVSRFIIEKLKVCITDMS